MSKQSVLQKHIAQSLAPTVRDTRKFRLSKPLILTVEEATKVAAAFVEAKEISGNGDLTITKFFVALAESLGKDVSNAKIERAMKEVFTVVGSGAN